MGIVGQTTSDSEQPLIQSGKCEYMNFILSCKHNVTKPTRGILPSLWFDSLSFIQIQWNDNKLHSILFALTVPLWNQFWIRICGGFTYSAILKLNYREGCDASVSGTLIMTECVLQYLKVLQENFEDIRVPSYSKT